MTCMHKAWQSDLNYACPCHKIEEGLLNTILCCYILQNTVAFHCHHICSEVI